MLHDFLPDCRRRQRAESERPAALLGRCHSNSRLGCAACLIDRLARRIQ